MDFTLQLFCSAFKNFWRQKSSYQKGKYTLSYGFGSIKLDHEPLGHSMAEGLIQMLQLYTCYEIEYACQYIYKGSWHQSKSNTKSKIQIQNEKYIYKIKITNTKSNKDTNTSSP